MELVYAFAGILLYILSGYLKSGEAFDPVKALRTAVVGVAAVVANMVLGVELPVPELETLLTAGEVTFVENLAKTLWRRVFSTL